MSDIPTPVLNVINLWAGPGAGKSTTAAGLFNLLKRATPLRVELVTEVAKDRTYRRDRKGMAFQLSMLGEQDARLRTLVGEVDWAICDSPLPMQPLYASPEEHPWIDVAAWGAYTAPWYRNHNFWVRRVKPYAPYGRGQTEEEALMKDVQARPLFLQACDISPDRMPWDVNGDQAAPYSIARMLGLYNLRDMAQAVDVGGGP
jgi:hypothetical protein